MIRNSRLNALAIGLVFCAALFGCDPDTAKRFEYGRPVPDFRLTVKLNAATSKEELFERFESLARSQGFTEYRGQPLNDRTFLDVPARSQGSFNWFPSDKGPQQYYVAFVWNSRDDTLPTEFLLIFFSSDLDGFSLTEWHLFETWRETILPDAFPEATIVVTGHPVGHTRPELVDEYARQSGVALPDRKR